MMTNKKNEKVSAKEAAKETLATALEAALASGAPSGKPTDKEMAKYMEQLNKIGFRLLAKVKAPDTGEPVEAETDDEPACD